MTSLKLLYALSSVVVGRGTSRSALNPEWIDYRLGDTVNGYLARKPGWNALHRHALPGSIVEEYLNHTHEPNRLDILCDITRRRSELYRKNEMSLPKRDEVVVHLRLGDTSDHLSEDAAKLLWTTQHFEEIFEQRKYLFGLTYYEHVLSSLQQNIRDVTIVGWHHHRSTKVIKKKYNSTSANRTKTTHTGSIIYRNILSAWFKDKGFNVLHRSEHDPDDDFVYMAHASHFVYGGGGFSHMVGECVKRIGGLVHPESAPAT